MGRLRDWVAERLARHGAPSALIRPSPDRRFEARTRLAGALSRAIQSPSQRVLETRFIGRALAHDDVGLFYADAEIPHPSPILEEFSSSEHAVGDLYSEMLAKSAALRGLWEKRGKAVVSLPRRITPRDSSPKALEAARFCELMLEGVDGFERVLLHQLKARLVGTSFAEVVPERRVRGELEGLIVPGAIIDRPMSRFTFRRDGLYIRRTTSQPLKAPAGRILQWTPGGCDSPWGEAPNLMDSLWWMFFLERHGWKSFAVAIEKWGQPTVIGKFPSAPESFLDEDGNVDETYTADQEERVLDLLSSIQTEQAIAFSKDLEVDTLEAKRSGSVEYSGFVQMAQRAMALLLLGELDTSGVAQAAGSFAKSKISNEVRLETVRLDAHGLGAHITDQLLRPYVQLNLGIDYPVPRLEIDATEAEDRQVRQDGLARFASYADAEGRPLPVPQRYIYSVHQVPEPRDGESVVLPWPSTAPRSAPREIEQEAAA